MFVCITVLCSQLTGTEFLWRHSYPHAGGCLGSAWPGQQVAVGQLQLHEDHGIGASDGVLGLAQVVLQGLALVAAQLPAPRPPRALVTQREDIVAEGGDGEPGALVREVRGGANHGEGSWGRGGTKALGEFLCPVAIEQTFKVHICIFPLASK